MSLRGCCEHFISECKILGDFLCVPSHCGRVLVGEAIAILGARLVDHGHLGEVAYGALRLARACHNQLQAATTLQDYEDVSAPLGSAIAVLSAANVVCDDVVLHGVFRLLTLCKETLDSALSEAV